MRGTPVLILLGFRYSLDLFRIWYAQLSADLDSQKVGNFRMSGNSYSARGIRKINISSVFSPLTEKCAPVFFQVPQQLLSLHSSMVSVTTCL
jgi:hypothetical protein